MSSRSEKIRAFNKNRLPSIVNLKYSAMLENAFRFYRGTCHLFYERISALKSMPKSPTGWISGDLHLENFGSYKGNNKLVYFDLNDFDEAVKAPVLWEVVRLVTSIFIAFQTLEIDGEQAMNMAALFLKSYGTTLIGGKAMDLDPRTAKGITGDFLKRAEKSSPVELLQKRTLKKGRKLLLDTTDERHFKLKKELRSELIGFMEEWLSQNNDSPYNYRVKDVVYRLAGTGSLGQKRYLFLLRSTQKKDHYLLLDMKQAYSSSLIPFLDIPQPKWPNEAERIVTVQKRMQHVSASLLSTAKFKREDYVIQELQPVKDTLKFKLIREEYRKLYQVIDDMAMLTASSQLRSSGMDGSATKDELKVFASGTNWQQQILDIATEQAALVCADFGAFQQDHRNGAYQPVHKNKAREELAMR
ncbi:DUF2252 domain-containing protein [Pedobacter kyungheensis]|uniref:DUF2252 domain-containing protein n=1 Tax=Pedobacter kyungheensis TaxID=1069985 RepID=UPI00068C0008|nr:DUF2252 family protein [Pedobacter kyungheensis]